MLLKIEKGFPQIYFIELIIMMVSFSLLNNKRKWGTSSLQLVHYIVLKNNDKEISHFNEIPYLI